MSVAERPSADDRVSSPSRSFGAKSVDSAQGFFSMGWLLHATAS